MTSDATVNDGGLTRIGKIVLLIVILAVVAIFFAMGGYRFFGKGYYWVRSKVVNETPSNPQVTASQTQPVRSATSTVVEQTSTTVVEGQSNPTPVPVTTQQATPAPTPVENHPTDPPPPTPSLVTQQGEDTNPQPTPTPMVPAVEQPQPTQVPVAQQQVPGTTTPAVVQQQTPSNPPAPAVVQQPTPAVQTPAPTPAPTGTVAIGTPSGPGHWVGNPVAGVVCPADRTCYSPDQFPGRNCDSAHPENNRMCATSMRRGGFLDPADFDGGSPNPATGNPPPGFQEGPNAYFVCVTGFNLEQHDAPAPTSSATHHYDLSSCAFVAAATTSSN